MSFLKRLLIEQEEDDFDVQTEQRPKSLRNRQSLRAPAMLGMKMIRGWVSCALSHLTRKSSAVPFIQSFTCGTGSGAPCGL